jgi:hypothetical protein
VKRKTARTWLWGLLPFVGAVTTNALATEYSRTVTVTGTLWQAASRPAYPIGQNFLLVYVQPAAWATSTCRQDAAAIKKEDTHLIATLLAALQTGKSITLHVDDTLRPMDGVICQVTMIYVPEP